MNSGRSRSAAVPVLAGLVLACLGVLGPAAVGQDSPSSSKSLILKDLLDRTPPDAGTVLRDIFRPKPDARPAAAEAQPGTLVPGGAPGDPSAPGPALPNADPPIIYIGFVRSERAMIGLILVGGQTAAVTAGEEIAPGYRVANITRTQIEVHGPDARVIVYALEGDEA